jgi:hypothetical protein
MAFPHPQSRKENRRKGDIADDGSVIGKVFERAVNISDYRDAEDDVDPAQNRTFDGVAHNWFVKLSGLVRETLQAPAREFFRLLQPGLDLFLAKTQFLEGMEVNCVVSLAGRKYGLERAAFEEQQFDVRLE